MSSVTFIVATFGDDEWIELGTACMKDVVATNQHWDAVGLREHGPDLTLAEVRNMAASRVYTDWLCFVDADDRLAPGYADAMIEQASLYEDSGERVLLAPFVSYDGREPVIPNRGRWPVLNECVIGTLVRRDLFTEVGGFHEWDSLEDYDLWLRCVAAGARIVHVAGAVYQAQSGHRRNANQSPYGAIVEANKEVFG